MTKSPRKKNSGQNLKFCGIYFLFHLLNWVIQNNMERNTVVTLQFEDLAVNIFVLHAYFCDKKSEIGIKCIFHKYSKTNKKKHLAEKSFSEGAIFKPFKHTMIFFRKMFLIYFFTFLKNAFDTNSRFFSTKICM